MTLKLVSHFSYNCYLWLCGGDKNQEAAWVLNLVYPQAIIVFDAIDILPLSSLLLPYVISDPVYHFIGCDWSFAREEWCEGSNTS